MTIATIPSSVLSFLVTGFLIVMIFRSRTRLKRPYRRLVLGVTVYGLLLSVSFIVAPVMKPEGMEGRLWSIGNEDLCEVQGFLMQMAVLGNPMYVLCLAIYYLFTVKHEMPDDQFAKKVEPYLHAVANGWPLLSALVTTFSGNNNTSSTFGSCWVVPNPENCLDDPDVECIRGATSRVQYWILFSFPLFASIVAFVVIMIFVCSVVLAQQRKMNSHRNSWHAGATQGINESGNDFPTSRRYSFRSTFQNPSTEASAETQTHDSQSNMRLSSSYPPQRKSNKMSKQVINQAITFCTIHTIIHGTVFIYGILQHHGSITFSLNLAFDIIFPLQGFLNIFALTRPFVLTLRRRNKEYGWFKSFWTVLKSGGDEDKICFRRRRSSVRRSSIMINQQPVPLELADLELGNSSSKSEEQQSDILGELSDDEEKITIKPLSRIQEEVSRESRGSN